MARHASKHRKRASEYLDLIHTIMHENDEFLHSQSMPTLSEAVELMNDAIDRVGQLSRKKDWKDSYTRSALTVYAFHILLPQSYAIYLDLLAGNIPACFSEVRIMLESLVKCHYADLHYSNEPFFQDKLEMLEETQDRKRISITKLMSKLGSDYATLWRELSRDWIHTTGLVSKLMEHLVSRGDVPAWALTIPMSYTKSDRETLRELKKRIATFRKLQGKILRKGIAGFSY